MLNEKKFIQKLKLEDQKAYERLYVEYAPKIYGILSNYIKDSEVEDALQEVFFKIYKGIKNFKGRSKLSTWIYRIAVNVGKNYVQKNKNKEVNFDLEEKYNEKVVKLNNQDDFSNKILSNINYEKMISMMEKLTKDEKVIIKLRDIENISYKEIANIMEIPIGTVKSKIHYSRKKLKKLIEEEGLL